LPCRTLPMPLMPSERSAPSIALPWGSRMLGFNVTVTRAFMLMRLRLLARFQTKPVSR
jgi:hypothetical protein